MAELRKKEEPSAVVAKKRLQGLKESNKNGNVLRFPVENIDEENVQNCGLVIRSEVEEEVIAPVIPSSVSPSVASKKKWLLNVVLGSAISFVDASNVALRPVVFLWQNLHVVSKGLLLLMLPLLLNVALLAHYPQLQTAFLPNTVKGLVMFGGLYAACSVTMLAAIFVSVIASQGLVKILDNFAACGEANFPSKK